MNTMCTQERIVSQLKEDNAKLLWNNHNLAQIINALQTSLKEYPTLQKTYTKCTKDAKSSSSAFTNSQNDRIADIGYVRELNSQIHMLNDDTDNQNFVNNFNKIRDEHKNTIENAKKNNEQIGTRINKLNEEIKKIIENRDKI